MKNAEALNLSIEPIKFFASFIERELGIVYSENNYYQLQSRLADIAGRRSLKSVDDLLTQARVAMTNELKEMILDIATNNETSFYRDPKLFDSIRDHIVPGLFAGGKEIRIWSAACSSGQEPYSMAMMLRQYAATNGYKNSVSILATDISTRILDKARKGRFTKFEVERGLKPAALTAYFDKTEMETWTIRDSVRSMVQFQSLNLLDSYERIGQFDLIFCRNVLIYQDVENKKRILKKLAARMTPTSYLFLGAGESMLGLSDDFESTRAGDAVVFKLKSNFKA